MQKTAVWLAALSVGAVSVRSSQVAIGANLFVTIRQLQAESMPKAKGQW